MPKQSIKFYPDTENPFESQTIELDVRKGTKILSKEPYIADLYSLYDQSQYSPIYNTGDVIEAKVQYINASNEAVIDLGAETAFIPLHKEKEKYREYLSPGNTIKVELSRKKDHIEASFGDVLSQERKNVLMESIGQPVGFWGQVKELIQGGYMVEVDGIDTFMPGSLAGMNKLWNFESMLGKEIIVVPINFSKEKGTIVVSHREYLKTQIPTRIEDVIENMDKKIEGFVTGATAFGVFAEFNECLTGMIPAEELVDHESSFRNKLIQPGDKIEFWVKQIIHENKIILSQKGASHDPWQDAESRWVPGSTVKGKVSKIVKYGAFIELEKGISGLLHSNDLKVIELIVNDEINVKVVKIDAINKKIVFTI